MMKRFKLNILIRVFGFVLMPLALIGCATTAKNIKTAEKLSEVDLESSIIYGQIRWLEDGLLRPMVWELCCYTKSSF